MMMRKISGFTLIETLVGIAVFLIIAIALYQAYVSLFLLIGLNQYKILALNLANEEFEIARNLSYGDVGEVGGVPSGKIPHVQVLTRNGLIFIATTTVRNVDLPFDGTLGGAPNDRSPADNKLVEVEVGCPSCRNFTPMTLTTTIAPRNLETASTNGALLVKVFDANGLPVPNADIHIVNTHVTPNIVIDDVTDAQGVLQVIDLLPGQSAYNITVSKAGYSTAKTYPPDALGNESPLQPDATILLQQVTEASFSIDKVSTLSFSSVSPTCEAVGSVHYSLTGAKSIGSGVPKYSKNLVTDSSGTYSNAAMEWDAYTVADLDSVYDIIGINPLNDISLNPNSTQNVKLIVAPKAPKSLLVIIKDSSTGLPLTDASVTVTNTSSAYSATKVTDRGYLNQTDWSGGPGQDIYFDTTRYSYNDGNIDTGSPFGELKLKNFSGSYSPSGVLISSTVDTGSGSNFGNLVWSPTDQPAGAGADSVKFQIATGMDAATSTWNFKGPDGTSGSYYTLANTTINPVHNGDRYVRYKILLSTNSSSATPNISDIAFTYTSSCTPPGQVVFKGLSAGTYHISVSKSGYAGGGEMDIDVNGDWTEKVVTLSP